MSCRRFRKRLGAYLDGDLRGPEREALRLHLEACRHCAGEADALRSSVALLRGLPPVEAPAHLAQRVIARLRDGEGRGGWLERASAWPSVRSLAVPVAGAAALALAALGARQLVAPPGPDAAEVRARAALRAAPASPPDLGLRPLVGAAEAPEDEAIPSAAELDALLERAQADPEALLRAWRSRPPSARAAWARALAARARGDAPALAAALRAVGEDAAKLAEQLEPE